VTYLCAYVSLTINIHSTAKSPDDLLLLRNYVGDVITGRYTLSCQTYMAPNDEHKQPQHNNGGAKSLVPDEGPPQVKPTASPEASLTAKSPEKSSKRSVR
jgi:hypothetical protein